MSGISLTLNSSGSFIETDGADFGEHAVSFAGPGTAIVDPNSTTMTSLTVTVPATSIVAGDELFAGVAMTVIDLTDPTAQGYLWAHEKAFSYAITDVAGIRTITFTSLDAWAGSPSPAPWVSYEELVHSLQLNNKSDTPPDGSNAIFTVVVDDGISSSAPATVAITRHATDDAPVLSFINSSPGFTEVAGPDTGANAVPFTVGGTIEDLDSTTLAKLSVSVGTSSVAAGDELLAGSTSIDITSTLAHGEVTAGGTVFHYAVADASGTRTITFTSLTGTGGAASPGAIADYQSLLNSLQYNNTSDTPADGSQVVFSVVANDGIVNSEAQTVAVTRHATNDAPMLTAITAFEGDEETQSTMTLADLQAHGNAADSDGSVTAFVVTSVASGTLLIGADAGTATAWAAGTNDTIDATHQAYWTPELAATGDQSAFTVVARDDGGLLSASPVAVQVAVGFPGLVITGTAGADNLAGTAGDDTIHGLGGNDVLTGGSGRDVLDGGAGTDSMDGGNGSDVYLFTTTKDHPAAEIHDSGTIGIDEVFLAATASGTLKLFAGDTGIERITIDPAGILAAGVNASALLNGVFIRGSAGANVLVGTKFNDTIDGGVGKDTMTGGGGSDTYFVDNVADKVIESKAVGTDLVISSVSYVLPNNVENLTLTGSAVAGTGNALANAITGNALDNTLTGGAGNDVLTGGAGADVFVFNLAPKLSTNFDSITDFASGTDKLAFKLSVFKALGVTGPLADDRFWSGAGATSGHDASDRIVYDTNTGIVYYDADGSGSGSSVAVAVLGISTHPALTAADILIV